jgi:hypothetical protein
MACGHCGNRQAVTLADTAVREHAFTELASLPAKPVARLGTAFICPNCGAHRKRPAVGELPVLRDAARR